MKKVSFLATVLGMSMIVLSGFVAPVFLQAEESRSRETNLQTDLETYKKAVLSQDAKGLVAMTYQGFFALFSKAQAIEKLKMMYQDGTGPVVKKMIFTQVGVQQPFEKGVFSIIEYRVLMELPRPGDATPQIDRLMAEMIKSKLGEGVKVIIDEQKSLVLIDHTAELAAILEQAGGGDQPAQNKQQGWTFLDKDQFKMLAGKNILPISLEKALSQ